eukprot:234893_1
MSKSKTTNETIEFITQNNAYRCNLRKQQTITAKQNGKNKRGKLPNCSQNVLLSGLSLLLQIKNKVSIGILNDAIDKCLLKDVTHLTNPVCILLLKILRNIGNPDIPLVHNTLSSELTQIWTLLNNSANRPTNAALTKLLNESGFDNVFEMKKLKDTMRVLWTVLESFEEIKKIFDEYFLNVVTALVTINNDSVVHREVNFKPYEFLDYFEWSETTIPGTIELMEHQIDGKLAIIAAELQTQLQQEQQTDNIQIDKIYISKLSAFNIMFMKYNSYTHGSGKAKCAIKIAREQENFYPAIISLNQFIENQSNITYTLFGFFGVFHSNKGRLKKLHSGHFEEHQPTTHPETLLYVDEDKAQLLQFDDKTIKSHRNYYNAIFIFHEKIDNKYGSILNCNDDHVIITLDTSNKDIPSIPYYFDYEPLEEQKPTEAKLPDLIDSSVSLSPNQSQPTIATNIDNAEINDVQQSVITPKLTEAELKIIDLDPEFVEWCKTQLNTKYKKIETCGINCPEENKCACKCVLNKHTTIFDVPTKFKNDTGYEITYPTKITCYELAWVVKYGWLAYGTDITGQYKVGLSHICGHGPWCVETGHFLYEYLKTNAERFHDHVEIDKKIKLLCLSGEKLGFTQICLEPGDKKLCKHDPPCIRTVGTSRNHNIHSQ